MRIFDLARKPQQWLRLMLAGLLLAFALNTVAHVTHRHDATPTSAAQHFLCNYCLSFGGVADGPRHHHALPVPERTATAVAVDSVTIFSQRPRTSSRPRAPPTLS
jgi:hypothetical protein